MYEGAERSVDHHQILQEFVDDQKAFAGSCVVITSVAIIACGSATIGWVGFRRWYVNLSMANALVTGLLQTVSLVLRYPNFSNKSERFLKSNGIMKVLLTGRAQFPFPRTVECSAGTDAAVAVGGADGGVALVVPDGSRTC